MGKPSRSEKPEKVPGWRQPWDTWRILMFVGALVLLAVALGDAFTHGRAPDWLRISGQVIGYLLLGVGFFLAMRKRRELREMSQKKK